MVEHATAAILAGHAEVVVLVYGSTTRADLKARRRTANLGFGGRGPVQFDVPFGHTLIAKYAMATRRHMHEYGTTIEQLAEIAVSTRYNACLNPEAYYRDPITIDEVQSERMMADPLTKLHCCIRSDGGGAVVLTTEERARDCAKKPVWVLGTGEATSHTTMSEWDDFTESPAARSGAARVRTRGRDARRHRQLPDLRRVHADGAARRSRRSASARRGEGGPFVADGKLRLGGALPTNTDGGGLSHCHPGMRGMFLLVEGDPPAARRGARPPGRERASSCCVNGTGGWFSSASTVILGVD